jgi:hypothetical protein
MIDLCIFCLNDCSTYIKLQYNESSSDRFSFFPEGKAVASDRYGKE